MLGAIVGFLVFDLPVIRAVSDSPTFAVRLPSVALLNVFPLVAVASASLVTRRIRRRRLGHFITGLSATIVYVLSLALLITLFSG